MEAALSVFRVSVVRSLNPVTNYVWLPRQRRCILGIGHWALGIGHWANGAYMQLYVQLPDYDDIRKKLIE